MTKAETKLLFADWLREYGEIFRIIDNYDSGNISYGVLTKEKQKCFVKFTPFSNQTAVKFLNNAYEIGQKIIHPVLTAFRFAVECSDGLALVYDWVETETMYVVTNNTKSYAKLLRTDPTSPYSRLKALPVQKIIAVLNQIFDLHVVLEEQGYVSCDWYDGSLMYNFQLDKLYVIDLDLYHLGSFTNTMGRMYGSRRFMAPEEFALGATIDFQTTVYHLGATVFSCWVKEKRSQRLIFVAARYYLTLL